MYIMIHYMHSSMSHLSSRSVDSLLNSGYKYQEKVLGMLLGNSKMNQYIVYLMSSLKLRDLERNQWLSIYRGIFQWLHSVVEYALDY